MYTHRLILLNSWRRHSPKEDSPNINTDSHGCLKEPSPTKWQIHLFAKCADITEFSIKEVPGLYFITADVFRLKTYSSLMIEWKIRCSCLIKSWRSLKTQNFEMPFRIQIKLYVAGIESQQYIEHLMFNIQLIELI